MQIFKSSKNATTKKKNKQRISFLGGHQNALAAASSARGYYTLYELKS